MAVKKKFPYRSAFVACNGGCHVTEGSSCSYGCIACGKCVESCKFGAIHLNEHGVAEVDEEKCIACGRCTRECPQHIIHLHDCANTIAVKCSNKDKGKDARGVCAVSCIGCGICVSVCPFQAIAINENGVAEVDEAKCVACGKCVRECPKQVIHIHECANYIVVRCSNKQNGKEARQVCSASCIGCGICEKTCTAGAVKVTDHCAVIDESVCLSCGMCVVKCPRHVLTDLRGIIC